MPTDEQIEQEIKDKGKTAPRVTLEHINACIVAEWCFTAGDAALSCGVGGVAKAAEINPHDSLSLLTICVLVLRNGFTVTGESACASPENFDAEIGRKIARDNAVNKVWMLEGYALKERLNLLAYHERKR